MRPRRQSQFRLKSTLKLKLKSEEAESQNPGLLGRVGHAGSLGPCRENGRPLSLLADF